MAAQSGPSDASECRLRRGDRRGQPAKFPGDDSLPVLERIDQRITPRGSRLTGRGSRGIDREGRVGPQPHPPFLAFGIVRGCVLAIRSHRRMTVRRERHTRAVATLVGAALAWAGVDGRREGAEAVPRGGGHQAVGDLGAQQGAHVRVQSAGGRRGGGGRGGTCGWRWHRHSPRGAAADRRRRTRVT